MSTIANLKEEFANITKIPMFEIEVINKNTEEFDYIIFDVSVVGNNLMAQHEPLSTKQEKSKKIACVKVALDKYFSLDENLQTLYEECINAIINSEFFELL